MSINKKSIGILCFVLIIGIIAISFFRENNFSNMVDNVRQQTVPMFDSTNIGIQRENNFENNIQLLIQNKDFTTAIKILDSAIKTNPINGQLQVYKGMVFIAESKYQQALKAYDSATLIEGQEYPLVQGKKADVFMKLHDYKSAMENYRKAAAMNVYYNCKIALTFEAMNKNDSALKYFLIYRSDHPHDTSFNKKISLLLNR